MSPLTSSTISRKRTDNRNGSMYVKAYVRAGAKREGIERRGAALILSVKEKAERNLANDRARTLIAREFKVQPGAVRIVAGHHAPSKTFLIKGL
jgi:uncharacterized protein YggU (UPF0235/DUF167 family)